ncbi:MAG: sodium:proton antiporter [Betaproteobacteria bacterium]|nr:MAG: sodium:proton antiporter [Betaproteobacteria bacterium]
MEAGAIVLAKQVLLSCGIVLAAGVVSGLAAQKLKVPDVVIFLLVGILLGPQALGWIDITAGSALNQIILIFGSCYILFDGGASLRFSVLKRVWITITVLATVGVLITAAITGVAAYYALGVPLIVALLLGAAIASTDPATLVPIFRQIHIRDRVAQTVMSESAFNDATGAIMTFAILANAAGSGEFSATAALADLVKQAGLGIIVGAVLGYAAALLIAHEKYSFLMEYAPVVTVMAVMGAYLAADGLQASGFMAVFVFGMVLGNKDAFGFGMRASESRRLDEFVATTAFVMRTFIFILLGAQVDFALMNRYLVRYLVGGVTVVTAFMLVARPITVLGCAWPDRRAKWSWQELLFMCWTRETGVIPAALAGLLLGMNAPGAQLIASVTFIAIIMTILIQATTTRWLARRLGLLVAG